MATLQEATRTKQRVPNSVQLAALLLIADAVVAVAGLGQILGFGDASTAGFQVFGTMYTLDTPHFPWVLTAMGCTSVVAAFTAVKLRKFQFVASVAVFWCGLAAITIGPGLLIERLVILMALRRGRSAFSD